jgi:hypothetical protein
MAKRAEAHIVPTPGDGVPPVRGPVWVVSLTYVPNGEVAVVRSGVCSRPGEDGSFPLPMFVLQGPFPAVVRLLTSLLRRLYLSAPD